MDFEDWVYILGHMRVTKKSMPTKRGALDIPVVEDWRVRQNGQQFHNFAPSRSAKGHRTCGFVSRGWPASYDHSKTGSMMTSMSSQSFFLRVPNFIWYIPQRLFSKRFDPKMASKEAGDVLTFSRLLRCMGDIGCQHFGPPGGLWHQDRSNRGLLYFMHDGPPKLTISDS